VTDIVLSIGPRRLFAVLSTPAMRDSRAPPVLIPNTGTEHRVGPNRLHVQMCRALASAGIPALRIDLSGFGDSPSGSVLDSTRDLQEAIDELRKRGHGEHVFGVGLCSGAHDIHQLARVDERVIGAAFIDGYAYPTPLFRLNYAWQRLSDPLRMLRNLGRRLHDSSDEKDDFDPDEAEYLPQPSGADMLRDLQLFMRRQMALMFVYTGQVQSSYNYRGQLLDAFGELRAYDRLTLHYLIHADHTFSRTDMRSQMISTLVQWLKRSSGVAPGQALAQVC
jgi:hypothetical protein